MSVKDIIRERNSEIFQEKLSKDKEVLNSVEDFARRRRLIIDGHLKITNVP